MSADTPWYQRWFGLEYLQLYPHRSLEEAAATIGWLQGALHLTPPAKILDLACGTGRHSAHLAALGFDLYSLDLSWTLLQKSALLHANPSIKPIRGDMRSLPFQSGTFDLALSLFTSFGYFEKEAEDQRVLQETACALKRSGHFVLDYLNVESLEANLIPEESMTLSGCEVVIRRKLDSSATRIEKYISMQAENQERKEYIESIRLYSQSQLVQILSAAGFDCDQIYGDYDGAPYTPTSPRLIMISSKRG